MTRTYKYIDDPPSILIWELDEVALMSTFFVVGVVTHTLTIFIVISFLISYLLKKVKEQRSEGFLLHYFYWIGVFKFKGSHNCPPSPGIIDIYTE